MADSDRSRSPLPSRNRQEQPGQRPALPCFPRWCGPMGSAVRSLSTMPRPQNAPKWPRCQPGLGRYGMGRMMTPNPPSLPPSWTMTMPQQFPPTPPPMPPPSMFTTSQIKPPCVLQHNLAHLLSPVPCHHLNPNQQAPHLVALLPTLAQQKLPGLWV